MAVMLNDEARGRQEVSGNVREDGAGQLAAGRGRHAC